MNDLTTKRLKIDRKRNTQTEVENPNHGRGEYNILQRCL